MAQISNEIMQLLMPILVVMVPSLLLYMQLNDRSGLLVGGIIGVVIGVSGGIIGKWAIFLCIIGLVTMFMTHRGVKK